MKSIEEQISSKCIHFNGIMSKCCKAGVNYDVFRKMERPFKFPCLKQGGECSLSQFPTDAEVKQRVDEIENMGTNALIANIKLKEHYEKTKEPIGKIKCECGGDLHYAVAQSNGHMRAKCSGCGISFVE